MILIKKFINPVFQRNVMPNVAMMQIMMSVIRLSVVMMIVMALIKSIKLVASLSNFEIKICQLNSYLSILSWPQLLYMIVSTIHTFKFKYPVLCSNKSVLNWT